MSHRRHSDRTDQLDLFVDDESDMSAPGGLPRGERIEQEARTVGGEDRVPGVDTGHRGVGGTADGLASRQLRETRNTGR